MGWMSQLSVVFQLELPLIQSSELSLSLPFSRCAPFRAIGHLLNMALFTSCAQGTSPFWDLAATV